MAHECQRLWRLRGPLEPLPQWIEELSWGGPLIFTMKVHHNGYFTPPPGRSYVNGEFIFVDLVDGQCLCMQHMHQLMAMIGYDEHERAGMKLFFKPSEEDLDTGLKELHNDHDVWDITNYWDGEPIPLEVFFERDGVAPGEVIDSGEVID